MLKNYYLLTTRDLHFKMQEYDVPMVNDLNKYEVNKIRSAVKELLRHVEKL